MIAYLDSSILLRMVLDQPNQLREWPQIEEGVASHLTEVECMRTLDRMRVAGQLTEPEVAEGRMQVYSLQEHTHVLDVIPKILFRASEPFPTSLTTLDAVHLATAIHWRERRGALTFATHDARLGTAARAMGFEVVGVAFDA